METQEQQSENQQGTEEIVIDDPKAVLEALNRAKSDAKKFREEKEKLEADLNTKDQLVTEYSGKLLSEKVKNEFDKLGFKDSEKLFKFIDFTKIDFDEEYNLVGFTEQYNQLKKDFPEVFDAKIRVGGQADGAATTAVNTKISASEMQARKILGRV